MRAFTASLPAHLALLLLAGDALVFLLFAVLGMRAHDGLTLLEVMRRTSAPFIIAWFGVGLVLGAYGRWALAPPRHAWWRTLAIWLPAGVLGLVIRIVAFDRDFVLEFAVVALVVGGLLLAGWRTLFSLLIGRWQRA